MAKEIKEQAFGERQEIQEFLSELLLGSCRVTDRRGIADGFRVKPFPDALAGRVG